MITKRMFISPHFDDFPLTYGGLASILRERGETKDITEVVVFSRSAYTIEDPRKSRGDPSNPNFKREIERVSEIRLQEELNCLKHLGIKSYPILLEHTDAGIRGYPTFRESRYKVDWKKDEDLFDELIIIFSEYLLQDNVEIYFPLAGGGHVDHLIVRNSAIKAIERISEQIRSIVFFGEDQPYLGLADSEDWKKVRDFVEKHNLMSITYPIDLERKVELLNFFPSQMKPVYEEGIRRRVLSLQKELRNETSMEKIYRYYG